MLTKSCSIDYWRKFFQSTTSSDLFEVIENAIMVAASDYPKEFKLRIYQIAETLFSCGCLGCGHVEVQAVPKEEGRLNGGGGDFEGGISKQEAEAWTEKIEEETQIVGEVLRIKEILTNSQDQNSKLTDEISFEKIERTKRKLHEGYQKAENAKKQRTIQVIELPGNHNRYWKGRR